MSDDLSPLQDWVGALAQRLSAAECKTLARRLATDLRAANADRIKRQVDPDGAAFAVRKKQSLRAGKGAIKRGAMFKKLRQAKFLKILEASGDTVAVGYPGGIGAVARVHQEGLRDKVGRWKDAKTAAYPKRRLLGFAAKDEAQLTDSVLKFLEGRG